MDERLLIREFIEALQERADEHYSGKLAQAFVDWYIEAEFGGADWKFTDDSGDGGIDAVVWLPGERPPAMIIQSKFTERVGRALVSEKAYEEYDEVIEAFHERDAFDDFIKNTREDARRIYRRVHEQLSDIGNWLTEKKAFRLISTGNRRRLLESSFVPRSAYSYAEEILELYRQYRKGQTPQAKALQLGATDKLPYRDASRGVTSYLFNAKVSDFRRYCETNDVGRLVARNIRFNLAGRVGRNIRDTYESEPHDFWYMHNGITIICDDYEERNGVATLVNPSVVNGAQTLYSIAASSRKASPALVATRIIVRGRRRKQAQEDDVWVQKIIRGVNTQNRVRAQDFRSNDPAQIELRNRFRDQKVFFERKRGEWREYRNEPRYRGFNRTTLKNVGLALAATDAPDGSGVVLVKRGAEVIFGEDRYYHRLFPTRALIARRFERIYLAYRLAKYVWDFGYRDGKEWKRQRHAYWTTVWLAHQGLVNIDRFFSRASVKSIRAAFDTFEENGRKGVAARKTIRKVREAVWSAWRSARRADIERWTANNFFKSAWGHKKVLQLAMPKVRQSLKALAAECTR